MEWTTKIIHTEHYSFELKININEDGPIKNITFLIGNEVKPCLYLIVPMGARNNRMQGHIDTAMMINLEGLRECLSESVSNDYFSEYSFAKEVVHKMIQIIKKFFPHIKRINLNDTSYIPCNRLDGDKLDLLTYSIALYGKTWYEKNFGAQQASSKYSEAVANYMEEKPVNFEEWYRFVKTYNIYAGRWIAERYDQIQNMFYASNTYPIFFKKLSDMIGFVEKCRIFRGWLLEFIQDRIPENRSWYIPLEMRGGGGKTRRRRQTLKRVRSRRRQRGGYRVIRSQTGRFVFDYPEVGQVSKFVSAEQFAKDREILGHIAAVDSGQQFTVHGLPIVRPLAGLPTDLKERLDLTEDPIYIIQSADGGPTMMQVLRTVADLSDEEVQLLFCALLRLGLHVIGMNRRQLLHGDMNLENIVYKDGVARLIDFEQMAKTPNGYDHAHADISGMIGPLMRLKIALDKKGRVRPPGLDEFYAADFPMVAATHAEALATFEAIFMRALAHC